MEFGKTRIKAFKLLSELPNVTPLQKCTIAGGNRVGPCVRPSCQLDRQMQTIMGCPGEQPAIKKC